MSEFQPWMMTVRPGDVLQDKHGSLRVVRRARVWRNKHSGMLHLSLFLAIRRCSWTGRCYTVIGTQDIVNRGFAPAGARVRLNKPIDRAISRDLEYDNRFNQQLTCCDVEGVP
jgi:hypothetical protein